MCEGIQCVFSILNDRKSDKTDRLNPTLDAAMHMFTKIDVKVKKEVLYS